LRRVIALYEADTDCCPKQLSDLAATSAPIKGYDASGSLQSIAPSAGHGPYIGSVPVDAVSGSPFNYSAAAPGVGTVSSSKTGNDITGVAFSTY